MTRVLVAEALGTALLLAAVVGSGIMADGLSGGNAGLALLANSLATGAALIVLITILAPLSGAHFNPAVTLAAMVSGRIGIPLALAYAGAQIVGAVAGTWLAHAMFGEPLLQVSGTVRTGTGLWLAETVATIGLVLTIFGGMRHAPDRVPALVGLYITAAYWFTASTSFANPAASLGRALTDSFAGIAPSSLPGFLAAQIAGGLVGAWLAALLFPAGSGRT
jgi:glycerol uptake facilitator-like aquaporin